MAKKPKVEQVADELSEQNLTETSSDKDNFCRLFGQRGCDDRQEKALKMAKKLLEAGPVVALAAVMLGLTNPSDLADD